MSDDWGIERLIDKIFRKLIVHFNFIFVGRPHNMIGEIVGLTQKPLRLFDCLSFRSPVIVLFAHLTKVGIDSILEFENFCFVHLLI